VAGCPNEARRLVPDDRPRRQVTVTVDGHPFAVQEGVTLKRALEALGYAFGIAPGERAERANDISRKLKNYPAILSHL
jgi:hypothetical protein